MNRFFPLFLCLFTWSPLLLLESYNPANAAEKVSTISSSPSSSSSSSSPLTAREQRLYVENPSEISIRFNGDHSYTIFLVLSQSLKGRSGNVLIPAGADISATMTLTDAGVQIVADNILIEGMEIPIHATSHVMSVQERVTRSEGEKIAELLAYSRPGGHALGTLVFDDPELGEMLGTVIPLVLGPLFIDADVEKAIYIPANQRLPMKVEAPIELPLEVAKIIHGNDSVQVAQMLTYGSSQVTNFEQSQSASLPIISQGMGCSTIEADEYIVEDSSGLSVYAQPTTNSEALTVLPIGSVLQTVSEVTNADIVGSEPGWTQIQAPISGYISIESDAYLVPCEQNHKARTLLMHS